MKYLSTHSGVYIVSFYGVSSHYIFSGDEAEGLGNLIQEFGQHGINFISRYNQSKSKFEKLSKAEVKNLFDWDTHSIEQLKKVNFIK